MLLQILGHSKDSLEGKTTSELKNMLQEKLGRLTDKIPCQTEAEALFTLLSQEITLDILQERRKNIPEIDMLLSIFE